MITIAVMSFIGGSLFSPLYTFYLKLKIFRAQYSIPDNLFFHWGNNLSFLNMSYFVKIEKWYWSEGFRSGGGQGIFVIIFVNLYCSWSTFLFTSKNKYFPKVKLFGKKQIERWAGSHFLCIDARLHLLYCISWPNYYTLLHTEMQNACILLSFTTAR